MTKINHFSSDSDLSTQKDKSCACRNSDKWNPNVPFQTSQEEFWEHIHEIERGRFTPLDEGFQKFEQWKTALLKSRL